MTNNIYEYFSNLIENKRQILIEIGIKEGFTSEKTLKISQELDEIIDQYMKAKH